MNFAISPGLTFHSARQHERMTISLSKCNGTRITGETGAGVLSGRQSCRSGATQGDTTVRWNTGRRSVIATQLSTRWEREFSVPEAIFSGKVVKGLFKGRTVAFTGKYVREAVNPTGTVRRARTPRVRRRPHNRDLLPQG
jgi:hypothetical protein